jgi:hypothetical protein
LGTTAPVLSNTVPPMAPSVVDCAAAKPQHRNTHSANMKIRRIKLAKPAIMASLQAVKSQPGKITLVTSAQMITPKTKMKTKKKLNFTNPAAMLASDCFQTIKAR